MLVKFLKKHRTRSRSAQTLVEYSLIISLMSLAAMSGLEELGVHIKGADASTTAALIWAQHNTTSKTNEIDVAWNEITDMLNKTFNSSKASELRMKNIVLANQLKIKNKFKGTN